MSGPDPIRLGGVLPLKVSLGIGPHADAAPTTGNDLATRWREDLTLLAGTGVSAVRFPFDWSRLQPRPGRFDDDWRELYGDVLDLAGALGIDVWPCLFEGVQPAWFDDEGGFADDRAATRWWPAWVEAVADHYGDRVAGWVPLDDPVGHAARAAGGDSLRHQAALHNLLVAWRDAWRLLRGGPPVATSMRVHLARPTDDAPAARAAARREDALRWDLWFRALRDGVVAVPGRLERPVQDLAGSVDVLGISTVADLGDDTRPDDAALDRWSDRAADLLHRTADRGPDRPIAVTLRPGREDGDECRAVVEAFGRAVTSSRDGGLRVASVWAAPVIAGPGATDAVFDRDRQPTSSLDAWLAITSA